MALCSQAIVSRSDPTLETAHDGREVMEILLANPRARLLDRPGGWLRVLADHIYEAASARSKAGLRALRQDDTGERQ
jgi:hypothetical protein